MRTDCRCGGGRRNELYGQRVNDELFLMAIVLKDGDILLVDGSIATSTDCCCDVDIVTCYGCEDIAVPHTMPFTWDVSVTKDYTCSIGNVWEDVVIATEGSGVMELDVVCDAPGGTERVARYIANTSTPIGSASGTFTIDGNSVGILLVSASMNWNSKDEKSPACSSGQMYRQQLSIDVDSNPVSGCVFGSSLNPRWMSSCFACVTCGNFAGGTCTDLTQGTGSTSVG